MTKIFSIPLIVGLFTSLQAAPTATEQEIAGWKLVWNDEFNGRSIDSKTWEPCKRGTPDWKNTMVTDPKVFGIGNGYLRLKGMVNRDQKDDTAPFHTGGVVSKEKFSFKYGKVVIRARYNNAKGAWPALWMLGEEGGWPANGEIDLMEHLNYDKFVYQTVHSRYTQNGGNTPKKSTTAAIEIDKYNTYGVEWDESKITLTVNGKKTLTYPRVPEKGKQQWPFDQKFYFVFSMQIDGSWVGQANPDDYPQPIVMDIDWVRVYEKE